MGLEKIKCRTLEEMKDDLQEFQEKFGLRKDWHEPDEQGISAKVIGKQLDNTFGEMIDFPNREYVVVLYHNKKEVGRINLATLLAVACSPHEEDYNGPAWEE